MSRLTKTQEDQVYSTAEDIRCAFAEDYQFKSKAQVRAAITTLKSLLDDIAADAESYIMDCDSDD